MELFWYPLVWLSRIRYCRGFGIQSPTDYQFVRYVINEHWPYYAYEQLNDRNDEWITRRLGRLFLRLANHLQPAYIIAPKIFHAYLQAGCQTARVVETADDKPIELAVVNSPEELEPLLPDCDEHSVVVIRNIRHHKEQWKHLISDNRTGITFDLYYCGIVKFDKKRVKQNYIINF